MISDRQVATAVGVAVKVFDVSRSAIMAELGQAPDIGQGEGDDALGLAPEPEATALNEPLTSDLAEMPDVKGRLGSIRRMGKGAVERAAIVKEKAAPLAHRAQAAMESDRVDGLLTSARERSQPLANLALGAVLGHVYPGHAEWSNVSLIDRAQWWSRRLGTVAAATAALPGFVGKGTKVDKLIPLLGATGQVLVVCAVCREGGVHDLTRMTQLSSYVVLGRQLSHADAEGALSLPTVSLPEVDFESLDLSPLKAVSVGKAVEQIRVIRRASRSLSEVEELLDARQRGGRFVQKAAGLAGIGALATFQSERTGIHKAAIEAARLVEQFG